MIRYGSTRRWQCSLRKWSRMLEPQDMHIIIVFKPDWLKLTHLGKNRKKTECSQCWSFISASNKFVRQKDMIWVIRYATRYTCIHVRYEMCSKYFQVDLQLYHLRLRVDEPPLGSREIMMRMVGRRRIRQSQIAHGTMRKWRRRLACVKQWSIDWIISTTNLSECRCIATWYSMSTIVVADVAG